jgi:hypothetical protein
MKYFIRKFEFRSLYFGIVFFSIMSITGFLMYKPIWGIIFLLCILAILFTGTVELEITDKEIITYTGLLKKKRTIEFSNIKTFYISYMLMGVGKILTKDNKKISITFGRFDKWGYVIIDVYNAIKNVEGIVIDKRIQEIVNANKK